MSLIFGDSSSEDLNGGSHDDQIYAAGGDDTVRGYDGDDIVFGGSGNDTIDGGAGSDVLSGGNGNDHLFAGAVGTYGYDVLDGDGGDDVLVLTGRPGAAHGGDGFDQLQAFYYGPADVQIGISSVADSHVFVGTDGTVVDGVEQLIASTSSGDDWIRGGDYADTLSAGAGANVVWGRGGDDVISYQTGKANTIMGGAGNDTLNIWHPGSDAFVFAVVGSVATDSYGSQILDVENFNFTGDRGAETVSFGGGNDSFMGWAGNDIANGGGGADTLLGGTGDDILYGGNGQDTLRGAAGDDILYGGSGHDVMYGGGGVDRFVIAEGNHAFDRIGDFHGGEDELVLLGSDYGLDFGHLDANRFALDHAVGSQGQFVYHTGDGRLDWDANGVAVGGVTEVAVLSGHPVLAASDFDLI